MKIFKKNDKIIIIVSCPFHEAKKVKFLTENKSEALWKVSSRLQSTTFNSLIVPLMQQSRTKSYRTGHHSKKRKHILAYRLIY